MKKLCKLARWCVWFARFTYLGIRRLCPCERDMAIHVTCWMLVLSAALGWYHWPPPSLAAYEVLIDWSRIEDGRVASVVRTTCAVIGWISWLLPWRLARIVGYAVPTLCAGMLMAGFGSVGQGYAEGTWLVGLGYGGLAIWRESMQLTRSDFVFWRRKKGVKHVATI